MFSNSKQFYRPKRLGAQVRITYFPILSLLKQELVIKACNRTLAGYLGNTKKNHPTGWNRLGCRFSCIQETRQGDGKRQAPIKHQLLMYPMISIQNTSSYKIYSNPLENKIHIVARLQKEKKKNCIAMPFPCVKGGNNGFLVRNFQGEERKAKALEQKVLCNHNSVQLCFPQHHSCYTDQKGLVTLKIRTMLAFKRPNSF